MLFGRNLITLIISGMATLAIAAPLKTAIPSTGDLIIREERVSKDASRSLNTILSGAHSDFGSILSQLEALDFKNDGSRSVEQISGQFQDIFLGVVNNFAKLAQTHQSNGKAKRDGGGKILGVDPVDLIQDASSLGNDALAIVNKVKDVTSHPAQSTPDQVKQISDAVSDILNRVAKAVPTVTSMVTKLVKAA